MLSWGLPLGKEAEFWLRVDKRKNTPRPRPRLLLWSAGQEGLICAPLALACHGVAGGGYGPGDGGGGGIRG